MPIFHCPICNYKSFTEKEEKEHAKMHQKEKSEVKNPEEQKKEGKLPNFISRFLNKTVSINLINGSTISGKLTGFNNYDMMLDDKILIPKHAMITMQEIEAK